MKTITFYSYKGGVGRSLALTNIARRLSELRKKVCIIDFDLDAPGLQFKFRNDYIVPEIKNGIVDYISEYTNSGVIAESILPYLCKLQPSNQNFETIDLIPAGNIFDSAYWKKLSMISWSEMFYSKEPNGVPFFLDLKFKIANEIKPDFLLIDSRTGITDISGITLRLFADDAVILAVNNEENLFGSKMIIKNLTNEDAALFGVLPKIHFVLTRIPFTDGMEDKLKKAKLITNLTTEFKKHLSLQDFPINLIHSDRRLEEEERPLIGYLLEEEAVSISNDYLKLFNVLTAGLLSHDELDHLQKIKKAEQEYLKGIQERQILKKLEHFDKAIALDPLKPSYIIARANLYSSSGDYEKALGDSLLVLKLVKDSPIIKRQVLENMAIYYFHLNRMEDALFTIKEQISEFPGAQSIDSIRLMADIYDLLNLPDEYIETLNYVLDELGLEDGESYNNRADYLRRIGEFTQAIKDARKAIALDPEAGVSFATLAEISGELGNIEDFYFYLTIAFSKGVEIADLKSAKDIYKKMQTESRLSELFNKFNLDLFDLLGD